ncbi:MAG: DNA polymerase III subunit delta [Verrucomicrobiales bacterium]|nr:DNA polymerase III subunit delta [Verrucomicrobiales bacterium]
MAAKRKTDDASASTRIWAIIGTDDLKVKEVALELCRNLTPAGAEDFGLEVVDGAADNTEQAIRSVRQTLEALQTLPFLGGEKVVWLKGVTFLADNQTGRSEATLMVLEEFAKFLQHHLPPDVRFLLTATNVDKRRSFFLTLKKIAHLEIYDAVDTSKSGWEDAVMPMAAQRASEYDLEFSPEALHLFVLLSGGQARQIDSELAKLSLFLDERRTVEVEDVREIVSKSHAGILWDLGNAIGSRHLSHALGVLDELLHNGENAVGILLAAIVPQIRKMFLARELRERHGIRADFTSRRGYADFQAALDRLPPEITAALPQKKEGGVNAYSLFMAAREAENFTAAELRAALEHCLNANRRLVTTGLEPKIVLTQLLMRILRQPPPRRKARTPVQR